MCARLLLRGVLMWLMPTHLLQSSLLTSKLKVSVYCSKQEQKALRSSLAHGCFTQGGKREEERGHTAHGCSTQGGKREEERGHSARMATAPEVGSTKGEGGVTLILLW